MLFVNWLTLSDPRAHFSAQRPQLPGQETPGLGLAREVGELLARVAERLGLAGVALNPTWYHVAYANRHDFSFVDPARQGRFEAMLRDLAGVPLVEATRAVADGRISMNDAPYAWEPADMVFWSLGKREEDSAAVKAERDCVRFRVVAAGSQRASSKVPAPAP